MILWDIIVILDVVLASRLDVRPMKTLSPPPFVALVVVQLTVVVYASQFEVRSDAPMNEIVTFHGIPTYSVPSGDVTMVSVSEPVLIPAPYTMAKPPETPITLPEQLVLTPFLPIRDRSPVEEKTAVPSGIVRGRENIESLGEILSRPTPLAGGPVADGTIDPKLLDHPALSDSEFDVLGGLLIPDKPSVTPERQSGTPLADPLVNGVLVAALIFTTLGLIYMAFIAYDYHQRWIHSLTAQNDRYLGSGTFDIGEDSYGSSISLSDNFGLEGFGFARRST